MEVFSKENMNSNDLTHPIILLSRFKKMMPGFELWDQDVIASEVTRNTGKPLSPANLNKLMAAKTLTLTDAPWQHWEVFNHIVMGLNGYSPNTDILHRPKLHELWFAVETINLLREENFREDSDVPRYVAAILLDENVQYAPGSLSFAQTFILNPMYKCKKCGAHAYALDNFKYRCRECSSEDIEILIDYDIGKQKERYEQYLKEESPTVEEDADSIAAGKLLLAHKYVELRLKELASQYNQLKNLF